MNKSNLFSKSKLTLYSLMAIAACMGVAAKANAQQGAVNQLDVYRRQIDSVDAGIIQLLGAREKIVTDVGVYKAANHIAPLQQKRFDELLQKAIRAGAAQNLSAKFITELMNAIHRESLRKEKALAH